MGNIIPDWVAFWGVSSPSHWSGEVAPLLNILLRDLIADAVRFNRRLASIETCLE